MMQIPQIIVILLILPALVLGLEFHERGHWLVGKIAGSHPRIVRRFCVARRVDHDLEEMPDRYLQYSGMFPLFLWVPPIIFHQIPIGALDIYLNGGNLELVDCIRVLVVYSFIISAVGYSTSDFIAMTDPEEYVRRMRQEGFSENSGYPDLIRYLLAKFSRL